MVAESFSPEPTATGVVTPNPFRRRRRLQVKQNIDVVPEFRGDNALGAAAQFGQVAAEGRPTPRMGNACKGAGLKLAVNSGMLVCPNQRSSRR